MPNEKTREIFLEHHGVIGMKWGVRNFQPYGHGGYDPEHVKGRYVGEHVKAGVKKGTIGGVSGDARFDKVRDKFGHLKNEATKVGNKASKSASDVKNKMSDAAEKASDKVKNATTSVKDKIASKIDTKKLKKAAAVIAVTAGVTLATVAVAKHTKVGRDAVRAIIKTADKLNTINTGYDADVHRALSRAAAADTQKYMFVKESYSEALQKFKSQGQKYNLARQKATDILNDKGEAIGVSFETELDWMKGVSQKDQNILKAFQNLLDKYDIQSTLSGEKQALYSEKHLSRYNTKRTDKALLALKTSKKKLSENLDKLAEKMRLPASDATKHRRAVAALQREGIAKREALWNKQVQEIMSRDYTEDMRIISEYFASLNAA